MRYGRRLRLWRKKPGISTVKSMNNYILNLKISGITCEACIKLIKKKVGKIIGVEDVVIKDNNGETLIVSENQLKISDIEIALKGLPYIVQEA